MTAQLPPGWVANWDEATGLRLYVNVQTGAQQYEFPPSSAGEEQGDHAVEDVVAEQDGYASDGDAQGAGGQEGGYVADNGAGEEGDEGGYGYAPDTDFATGDAAQQDVGQYSDGSGNGDGGIGYADPDDFTAGASLAQQSQFDDLSEMEGNDNDGMTADPALLSAI